METIREFHIGTDRCDRCGSQAYHAANKDGAELLFCAHHMRQHHNTLLNTGWEITTDVTGLERIGQPARVS